MTSVERSVLPGDARDRLYASCAGAVSAAGLSRESLYLARLVLLLFEEVGDEAICSGAIAAALDRLPEPSLSAPASPTAGDSAVD